MRIPKVSVVMASYNHRKYVTKAIDSVLAQTYDDWELIIIDDCSSDDSAQLIGLYKDKRITFYQAEENRGSVPTFNQLMSKAQGEYVAILGSDDIWYPNKLRKQVEYLDSHTDMGACFSYVEFIDEEGEKYSDKNMTDFNGNVFNQPNRTQGECFRYFFQHENYFCHPSSMVRRNVIKEIGNFDLRFRQLHDYHYWIRLLQKYPVYIIQEPLTGYRRIIAHNKSVSASNEENTIRHINESQTIMYEMIKDMKRDIFCEAFSDLLREKVENDIQLICEKYFILLDWEIIGINNRQPAIRYLGEYINNPEVMRCLKEKYNYNLCDYYKETSSKLKLYPIQFYQEYQETVNRYENICGNQQRLCKELEERAKNYSDELNVMRQTTSWKVTRPLREIKGVLKKSKKKPKYKGTAKK